MMGYLVGGPMDNLDLSIALNEIIESGYSEEKHEEELKFFRWVLPARHRDNRIKFMVEESLWRLRMYQDFKEQQ